MDALRSRCGHYVCSVVYSFFLFSRLIAAVADWMSAILPHGFMTGPFLLSISVFMAVLCNRGAIIFLPCSFFPFIYLSFFSSPNLSGRRLDVYHTSTHGVALVLI